MGRKLWKEVPRSKRGSLGTAWFKENFDADESDTIICFELPETDAQIMVKMDPFKSLPTNLLRALQTQAEYEAEIDRIKTEAIEEYKAEQRALATSSLELPGNEPGEAEN